MINKGSAREAHAGNMGQIRQSQRIDLDRDIHIQVITGDEYLVLQATLVQAGPDSVLVLGSLCQRTKNELAPSIPVELIGRGEARQAREAHDEADRALSQKFLQQEGFDFIVARLCALWRDTSRASCCRRLHEGY